MALQRKGLDVPAFVTAAFSDEKVRAVLQIAPPREQTIDSKGDKILLMLDEFETSFPN